MPIYYALISREGHILSESTARTVDSGNFQQIALQILSKLEHENNTKRSFSTGGYVFNIQVSDGIVYMCLVDSGAPYPPPPPHTRKRSLPAPPPTASLPDAHVVYVPGRGHQSLHHHLLTPSMAIHTPMMMMMMMMPCCLPHTATATHRPYSVPSRVR